MSAYFQPASSIRQLYFHSKTIFFHIWTHSTHFFWLSCPAQPIFPVSDSSLIKYMRLLHVPLPTTPHLSLQSQRQVSASARLPRYQYLRPLSPHLSAPSPYRPPPPLPPQSPQENLLPLPPYYKSVYY